MNEVRQKILDTIVEPAADGRTGSTLTGTIINSDEKSNTCDISYVRQDGRKINKSKVPIMLTNKSFIDWFPEPKESVLLQEKNNVIYVMGPASSNYSEIRKEISLANDIFSDSFVDVLGGFLF